MQLIERDKRPIKLKLITNRNSLSLEIHQSFIIQEGGSEAQRSLMNLYQIYDRNSQQSRNKATRKSAPRLSNNTRLYFI